MTKQLDDNDIAWLNEYASSVTDTFSEKFGENSDRFKEGSQLVERFNASIAEVKKEAENTSAQWTKRTMSFALLWHYSKTKNRDS